MSLCSVGWLDEEGSSVLVTRLRLTRSQLIRRVDHVPYAWTVISSPMWNLVSFGLVCCLIPSRLLLCKVGPINVNGWLRGNWKFVVITNCSSILSWAAGHRPTDGGVEIPSELVR